MRLTIFAFGKLRTPGLREAADYYSKMIQPWVPLTEVELKPISVPDKSPATRKQIQEKEGAFLLDRAAKLGSAGSSRVGGRGALYLLDEGGKELSTQGWATLAREWEDEGYTEVGLCIGSSLGFSPAVRKAARGVLSLGPQTLPHELARVVLLEQMYRAWSVLRNHPYHNEGA